MTSQSPSDTPPRNPTLEDAWRRFAKYDRNAGNTQVGFIKQRKLILGLGVAATTLAVLSSVLQGGVQQFTWLPGPIIWVIKELINPFLSALVIITPVALSVLVAGSVKFNMGISWVMLRSSAEALKKEIYRYRMQVEEYNSANPENEPRDVHLARKIKLISKRLMETQVNQTGLKPYNADEPLPPYAAKGDDGFSDMTAADYLAWRVEDQFNYYQKKALRFSQELQRFQWLIYVLGGLGTLLGAFKLDIWIAVSSALATAFASFLEFKRVETTVVSCNMAAADLYDIRAWWRALPESAKTQQANIETLVSSTESVIQSENAGWVQEMRDALSEIYGSEEEKEEGEEGQEEGQEEDAQDDQPIAKTSPAKGATSEKSATPPANPPTDEPTPQGSPA